MKISSTETKPMDTHRCNQERQKWFV